MFTRETDYAIRMVLCLAESRDTGGRLPVSVIAKRMAVPYRFLRALGGKLAVAGLVRSHRGNAGGFELARPPSRISLLDVIQATDPRGLKLNACLLEGHDCTRSPRCAAHRRLARLQKQIEKSLAQARFDRLDDAPERTAD